MSAREGIPPDEVERKTKSMKVSAYVLILSVALIGMSAGSRKAKPTVGVNPGDLAPGIEFSGNGPEVGFRNQSGRYTLLNFWAAYDAESRARNVRLANEVSKWDPERISLCSISLDERESIFAETVRMDGLNPSTQFHEEADKRSAMCERFGLEKGFRNFLIDDEGVIVAANVTPERLTEILSERN